MVRRTVIAVVVAVVGLQLGGAATAMASSGVATPGLETNITKLGGNQSEAAIAIDPLDPNHVVELSNRQRGGGMIEGVSDDGGQTWTVSDFARNDLTFGDACCDPTMSWDAYGNLFVTWLDLRDVGALPIAMSVDGGHSFTMLKVLHPAAPARRTSRSANGLRQPDEPTGHGSRSSLDQPTITTGPGSVWVDWNNNGTMQATGAPVTGLDSVGKFIKREDIDRTRGCSFGDLSIGPSGQVMMVCTKDKADTAPVVASIRTAADPDGLGPQGFTPATVIGTTNCQQFDPIKPQRSRTVDAETGLAWDTLASSPHLGRLYLIWTDEQPNGSSDTDIWLRYSDDTGTTWSTPTRVNDVTTNAQFLPRIAVDPTTGNIAIGWHDARNDLGAGAPGDTDGKPNTDAMYYLTFSTDGGATFLPAVQVATGASNAKDAQNGIDFGDYTGLAFFGGVAMPAWADNSNSTGDNPAGALRTFDIYTSRVTLT